MHNGRAYVEYLDFLDNLQLMEGEDLIIWIKNVFSVSEKFSNLFFDPPIFNQGLYTYALFKTTQQVHVSPCMLFCPLAVVASHNQVGSCPKILLYCTRKICQWASYTVQVMLVQRPTWHRTRPIYLEPVTVATSSEMLREYHINWYPLQLEPS